MIKVHMFWQGTFTRNEILCIRSFVKNGYDITVWSYSNLQLPEGARLGNANEIIPQERIFQVNGSYAPFADLFRLAVVNQQGGMWADADVIAVRHADELPNHPFLVTEQLERVDKIGITNNIFYNPKPEQGNLIDIAFAVADRFPPEKIVWTTIGPDLLQSLHKLIPDNGFEVMPVSFANPYNSFFCPESLLDPTQNYQTTILPGPGHRTPDTFFVHLYNELWRRKQISKDCVFPDNSIMWDLEKQYG